MAVVEMAESEVVVLVGVPLRRQKIRIAPCNLCRGW